MKAGFSPSDASFRGRFGFKNALAVEVVGIYGRSCEQLAGYSHFMIDSKSVLVICYLF